MTNEETLQRAKVENRRVTIVTRLTTLAGVRVIDVDGSNVQLLVGERERRQVHTGDIVSVTEVGT